MSQVAVEAFVSVPPCSGGVMLKRLLRQVESEFGDQIEVTIYTGATDKAAEYSINNAPALVVDELVKFVGLCPSYESLVGALREVGVE